MSHVCICCSARSIQQNRFSLSNMSDYQKTAIGLRCCRCSTLLCAICINKLSEAIIPIKMTYIVIILPMYKVLLVIVRHVTQQIQLIT